MMIGPALLQALDEAYEAFAGYPRPRRLDVSPVHDARKILATLSSAPLRELTAEQIGPYAGSALTTMGSVADYKHFLPRILEQAVRASEWLGTDPPIIAAKLEMAQWRSWPRPEQSAVLAVFRAAWRDWSQHHPDDGPEVSEWLCGLAALGEDVEPLLRELLTRTSGNSLLQLAKLVMELPLLLALDPHEQIFWADVVPEVRIRIAAFLISPEVGAALAAANGVAEDDIWYIKAAEDVIAEHFQGTRH